MSKIRVSIEQVHTELFRRGNLKWLLYPHQRPIYDKIREVIASDDEDVNSYVIDCARQFGKSFIMFTIAVEECLRAKHHTIAYVAPLKSQVIEIVTEKTFRTVFADAPPECIPKLDGSALVFQNGSRIRLAGTDNKNYANLRGGIAHQVLLDEAGFMAELADGVLPSVTPMLKTTGGKIIFASTPPDSLDHDYQEILRDHDESGHISTYTIWDDKSLSEKQLNKIIQDCRGQDTTLFKREYECKRIVEEAKQVVPELSFEVAERILLKNTNYKQDPLFQFYHKYVIADWGGRDKTAVLFGHYNYRSKKVVIEDHLDLQGNEISAGRIAKNIKDKTAELWPTDEHRKVIRYICDSNNILVQTDMINNHNLPFTSTTKDRLAEQMVQKLRDWVYDDRIEFAPNAEFALKCSTNAFWAKGKNMFGRSKIYGHYDALAALIYFIRNVDTTTDPIPRFLNVDPFDNFIMPDNNSTLAKNSRNLTNIFNNPRKGLSLK